ncbi:hypothetical protein C2H98_18585 [Niallia circulans]|nr:hypothetical protein C2H98_18585 [Niallia circulans]
MGNYKQVQKSLEVVLFNIEEALNLIENNDYKDISEAGFDLFRKDSKDFKLWDFWLAVMRGKSNKREYSKVRLLSTLFIFLVYFNSVIKKHKLWITYHFT